MNARDWKEIIDMSLHGLAQRELDSCNICGFLDYTDNLHSLNLLSTVIDEALSCNQLECAFIDAFTTSRTNNYDNRDVINLILKRMDFEKLRKQGDIIPERNEYYLYRGVSGDPTPEILNGISWTGNLDLAHWFAMRYADFGNPSVYTTTVKKDSILFRTNVRDEDEYVLNPGKFEAQFLTQAYEEIAEKYQVTMDQEKAKELAKLMAHKD